MDEYTQEYFFKAIKDALDERPIQETKAVFIYLDTDGLPVMLHHSGNEMVGALLPVIEKIFGFLGESSYKDDGEIQEPALPPQLCCRDHDYVSIASGIRCARCGKWYPEEKPNGE